MTEGIRSKVTFKNVVEFKFMGSLKASTEISASDEYGIHEATSDLKIDLKFAKALGQILLLKVTSDNKEKGYIEVPLVVTMVKSEKLPRL